MNTIGEEGSNILDATSDITDLLRLAQSAVHRLKKEVHGEYFETVDDFSKKLLHLREEAESINNDMTQYVKDIESK